ncbi:MAG TPA: ankyrin repeat domain-containing protein, partial [Vicinamibacterales bacterium]
MTLKLTLGSCLVVALVSTATVGAATRSDVADAVMRGDTAAVRALIAQKADVNAPQADGATALHWAVYREDLATTDLLLQAGAAVKVANREGATPLSLACMNGNPALIESLLKAGADSNEKMPRGETALMMASRTGNLAAMKLLLDRGADVNAKEALRGTTALMWAADQGHAAAVQLLVDRGAELNVRSNPASRGRTAYLGKANDPRKSNRALAAAAAGASPEEVARLSSKDNRDARTPAPAGAQPADQRQAAGAGRRQPAGARPAGDQQGQEAAAAQQGGGGFGEDNDLSGGGLTPLIYAARANSLETVQALLAKGADVNQTSGYGWSALLVATQNRFYQLGAYLLDHGADPNKPNNGGWTPLYLAVDNRNIESGDYPVRKGDMDHLDFIKKLLDKGANVNARMKDSTETRTVFTNQWLDENGATAFLRASQSSDLVVMRLLLAHGADPKIATVGNVTALQV